MAKCIDVSAVVKGQKQVLMSAEELNVLKMKAASFRNNKRYAYDSLVSNNYAMMKYNSPVC
jgi:hypothetical protein